MVSKIQKGADALVRWTARLWTPIADSNCTEPDSKLRFWTLIPDPDSGPWFETLFQASDYGPWFRTLITDCNDGPWFFTLMWTLITDSYCITGPDYKLWFRTVIPDSNYRLYNYGPWLCTLIRTLITDSWTRIPNSESGPCYSDSGPFYQPWFLSWIRTLIADPDYEPFLNSFFQNIKHNSGPKLWFLLVEIS